MMVDFLVFTTIVGSQGDRELRLVIGMRKESRNSLERLWPAHQELDAEWSRLTDRCLLAIALRAFQRTVHSQPAVSVCQSTFPNEFSKYVVT